MTDEGVEDGVFRIPGTIDPPWRPSLSATITRRLETSSQLGVWSVIGWSLLAWQFAGAVATASEAEIELTLEPPAQARFEPKSLPVPSPQTAASAPQAVSPASQRFVMPDLREIHKAIPQTVESVRHLLRPLAEGVSQPAKSASSTDRSQTTSAAPLPIEETVPWRDPAVQLPLPLKAELPSLARMPLVNFKPDPADQGQLYRVTDDPSVNELLPSLEPALQPVPSLPPVEVAPTEGQFAWPKTPQLNAMLARLEEYPQTNPWAASARAALQAVQGQSTIGSSEATPHLKRLSEVAAEAIPLAEHLDYGWVRTDLTQTYYALLRRLDLWNEAHKITQSGIPERTVPTSLGDLMVRLETAEEVLRDGGQLLSWSDYLQFKQLRQAIESNASPETLQKVAQQVLERMHSPDFDSSQRELLAQPPFLALSEALRPWLGIEFQPEKILANVEQYELNLSAADARQLATEANLLQYHAEQRIAEYGRLLDHTYRNANARIEVHQKLMQAFLPELEPDEAPVDDYVLGNRVRGRSRLTSQLQVRTVSDSQQWRVQMEVIGAVESQTVSSSGPVTVSNRGRSRYHAAKQVVVNSQGFWVSPAVARATTSTDIDRLETDFDGIPLIGSLVRNVARGQTQEQKYLAEQEVQRKIRRRAEDELNRQLNEKVQYWQDRMYVNMMEPLVRLGLDPSIVDLNTNSRAVAGRFRAAGAQQLAAHTPRPIAPLDSVFNIQLHQSGINNMIRRLKLGGRDLTPQEFLQEIAAKFPAIRQDTQEELPAEVLFRFSEEEPIRLTFADGQAQLTLRLNRLQVGSDSWEDLEVSALYSPTSLDWDATFRRDSTVFLKGKRLGFRDQLALRAVFLKVLSKKHEIPLFPPAAASDPRVAQFAVNQLALHEGWFAISLGPTSQGQPQQGVFRVADEPTREDRK